MPKNEKEKKKHISPKKPEDLWTCSSYLARDLVAQYLRLGVLSQTDAVALYIVSGVLEFGREKKPFYETPKMIARALGLSKDAVKTYLGRLLEDGVITRTETTEYQRKERKWSIPCLPLPNDESAVSSVVNTTLETEKGDGGHNAYPDRDTPSSPREETSCSPEGDTPCGLHLRESYKEESEEENHIGKECPKTPSCVSKNSSFKKRSKTQTRHLLESFSWDRYQLDSPEGLASCWAHLVEVWRSPSGAEAERDNGSAAEIDPMENRRAFMTLKQMRIYKNPETVRLWLEWYIKSGGLNKSDFITRFSKSWDDYTPIAARAFVVKLKEEEVAWAAELNARYDREAGKTMPAIEFHRGLGEEELQRLRESFHASLPDEDAIRDAVDKVPIDADLNDDDQYVKWLVSLAKAVPVLGPFTMIANSDRHLDFVRLARDDFPGDLEGFAEMTRDYVVCGMKYYMGLMEADGCASPRIISFAWRNYANYFDLAPGIEEAERSLLDTEDETPQTPEDEQGY